MTVQSSGPAAPSDAGGPESELAGLVSGPLFESVQQARAEYEQGRAAVIDIAGPDLPEAARYAFAAHRLASAVEAAEAGNREAFDYYRGPASSEDLAREALQTASSCMVVRSWDGTGKNRGRYGDMPALPIGLLPAAAPPPLLELARDAVGVCQTTGFGELLMHACAVLVLLKRRGFDEVSSSWTTSALPCTVFCDHHGDAGLLAVDMVHETTHNLLNEILDARDIRLSEETRYFSPWKKTDRPAFGFLHSIVAFSAVVTALRRVVPLCASAGARDHAERRLGIESGRLALVSPSVSRLLENDIRDPHLIDAVEIAYARALP